MVTTLTYIHKKLHDAIGINRNQKLHPQLNGLYEVLPLVVGNTAVGTRGEVSSEERKTRHHNVPVCILIELLSILNPV